MQDNAFREKPVSAWTDADFDAFRSHITGDVLVSSTEFRAASSRFVPKNRALNIFDSANVAGSKNSPFEWHRDVKSRLRQAELVNQDLDLLSQCVDTPRFSGLSDSEQTAMFDGMADKMATIRYGYEAGRNPNRAADYKSHMAMTMKYGGVDIIRSDIDHWRSGMQEMLNSEYERAMRPDSRYVCRFFNRDSLQDNFESSMACVFFDVNLLDAYVQEYVADRHASEAPIKDMFKFTTAAGDYDLRYRIMKSISVGQGLRVMPKEDWVNNSKAQTAFSNMAGWGLSGEHFAKSDFATRDAIDKKSLDIWLVESQGRVERANKLYEDLEALSELPLDIHGSLKYQPSASMCSRCGWLSGNNPEKKSPTKAREAAFQRDLLLRAVDVLYGPDAARELQSDFRKAASIPTDLKTGKNDIQIIWDEIRAGKFSSVKDRVIEWSGERLDVIEQEEALRASGVAPAYLGSYHGQACHVYSDAGAVACMGDVFQSSLFSFSDKSDGLQLPETNQDLMYQVYAAAAKIRGDDVLNFEDWHAGVLSNPDLNLSMGEFDTTRPEIARPQYLSGEELKARMAKPELTPGPSEQLDSYAYAPDSSYIPEPDEMQFDGEAYAPGRFDGQIGQIGRDAVDLYAAAAAIPEPVEPDETAVEYYS